MLLTKYTHLQESLSDTVRASDLPWLQKSLLSVDLLRATYLEDTPVGRHARKELERRLRFAAADNDVVGVAKYALLAGTVRARRSTKRLGRRAGRLVARVRT